MFFDCFSKLCVCCDLQLDHPLSHPLTPLVLGSGMGNPVLVGLLVILLGLDHLAFLYIGLVLLLLISLPFWTRARTHVIQIQIQITIQI